MSKHSLHRREFIRGASAALAMSALRVNGMDLFSSAPARRVALIGTGWYGKSDLFRLIQVAPVEVIGLCDVDKHQLDKAAEMVSQRQQNHKKPALYGDYRKMLAEQKPDIVLIGSPDHWHALQAIEAVKSGAHVYVQKPISVDVMEGEAMVAAARKYNRVV
ncbi:MAG: Gfo/Idh/MocA family oxidoreductase, partial [Bacteroidota bacterium]